MTNHKNFIEIHTEGNRIESYDKIIIGAGIYGLYSALFCCERGQHVIVLECDPTSFRRATYINQARVHQGYHCPRSIWTAMKSAGYFERFNKDYAFCINKEFDQIYATSSQYSWSNGKQFKQFCRAANIPCEEVRMGIWCALQRGYKGVITIDGNNKDSIEDVPHFIDKLKEGYDLIQSSRFIKGGKAVNTPFFRMISVKLIHVPVISLTAHQRFTDTTNAYRAYSARYLQDERVQPLRDVFMTYELLAYLSVRATQLGYRACEIPVTRAYPKTGKTPTKISFFKGNSELMKILLINNFYIIA